MIYVGIDIAKLNHFASAISSDGEILMEPFQFSNDSDGFHMLLSRLDSWSYVKKKYKLNMPFLRLAYPARASAFSSNAA